MHSKRYHSSLLAHPRIRVSPQPSNTTVPQLVAHCDFQVLAGDTTSQVYFRVRKDDLHVSYWETAPFFGCIKQRPSRWIQVTRYWTALYNWPILMVYDSTKNRNVQIPFKGYLLSSRTVTGSNTMQSKIYFTFSPGGSKTVLKGAVTSTFNIKILRTDFCLERLLSAWSKLTSLP